jgi:hypothetical protein
MLNPIAILCDPLGFIHYCCLSAKLFVCRLFWPQCSSDGCRREAADWSRRHALCAWHFDAEVNS